MMKRRVSERILVLILSMAVLLSSTGVYSVFAETYGDSVSLDSSKIASSSSAAESENGAESTNSDPNVIAEGGAVETEKLSGTGTASDPYLISDADDLFRMQDIINDSNSKDKFFTLTDDIDLSGVSYADLRSNSVVPGTIVSADKAKSEAAPDAVQFTLNGRNHRIYGLNVTNTGSDSVAIFGYVGSKSTIKNIDFENIKVSVSYRKSVSNAVIILENNGQFRNCTVKNVTVNVDDGAENKNASTGIVGENTGSISNITVRKASLDVQSGRENIGVISGINSGYISNVKVASATVKTSGCDAVGIVAGFNSGKIEDTTVDTLTANVSEKTAFGGIAGKNTGMIISCVASGKANGSALTGGIVGEAVSTGSDVKPSNVKNCYSFVRVEANSENGAVIATGESRYSDNTWSSETSGRKTAYSNGETDGDFVRETRFVVVEKGEKKAISKASLGGKFNGISYVLDSTMPISFSGNGISCSKTSDSVIISASEADKIGYLTYTARVAVSAGYDNTSVVSQKFEVVILTVPEGTNGDGLSESTALEISNGAELRMISTVPYAHFKIDKDIRMPDNWDSSFILTGSVNGCGHKLTATGEFCKAVYGKISDLDVKLSGKICTAFFGNAVNAEIRGIELTKSGDKDTALVAEKSETGAFLNSVSGTSTIIDCFSNIPVYLAKEDINSVAGFIGSLEGDNVTIKSCGVSSSITSKNDESYARCAAFIGKADENKNGIIRDCYATLYSDAIKYVIIGGGSKEIKVENSIYSSSNKKAVAAPSKFTNVNAEKWMFESGENGFVTGKGSVVSIVLPSAVLNSGKIESKYFKAMYDAKDLEVDLDGMTVNNGVALFPVEIAEEGATVRNSSLVIVHKPTGLRAEISISNGIEKDEDGNYLLNCGADFTYINDNFDKFCDKNFVITKDIDMSYVDFTAVGGSSEAFSGKINGKGHTISGLKANEKSKSALFGTLDGAVIENIVFESAVVNTSGSYAGVLAAQVTGGTKISSVSFNGCKVSADENYAGVLAGEIKECTIKDIVVEGCKVSALNNAGAVAGAAESVKAVELNISDTDVFGSNFAGTFGEAENSTIKSVEIGDSTFKAKQTVGGVAGSAKEVNISDVVLKDSKVSAVSDSFGSAPAAGGICGTMGGTVKNAEIESSVIASKGNAAVAGGIVAISDNAVLNMTETDENTKVKASVVGGLVGEATGKTTINNSKSCAAVSGSKDETRIVEGAGGVIGRVEADDFGEIKISKTNVTGSVSAAGYVGGIIGSVLSDEIGEKSVVDCVSAAKLDETASDKESTSGHVIGFVTDLKDEDISNAVDGVVFTSYDSELGAYGNVKADETYCDLDSAVESSLSAVIDTQKEKIVKVSNNKAEELGFEFDNEKGWQSDSENRVAVVASSENKVKLAAEKTGIVSIVGTYTLQSDEDIELNVHFDAETEIDVTLSGNGTKESPYIVSNASELEAVSNYAGENAVFELTNDIVFDASEFEFGGEFYNDGKGFAPIGTSDIPFNGTFNGNGHVISGIIINDAQYAGLFGYISESEISGIRLENADIKGNKLASAIAASAKDSKITDVSVSESEIFAQSSDGSAAAVAAFAENSVFEILKISLTEITAGKTTDDCSASFAGTVCAIAIDVTVNKANIAKDTKVVSAGTASGIIGYCDNVEVVNSKTYAEVSGSTCAAMAGTVKGQLAINNVILGGKVSSDELAAGIAAKAEAAIIAKDVVVSSSIIGNGEKAVVAAYADESVFCDSDDVDVKLDNVVYSSYKNDIQPFASEKINAYQKADYIDEVIDVNSIISEAGKTVTIGKDAVKISEIIKSEYDLSKFTYKNVFSVPENLVVYNKSDETVYAVDTAIEDAELVIEYTNGLKIAVDIICIEDMTGDGTEESPYIIRSEEALELLRLYPQNSFRINKDIELTKKWTPVENFTGTLNGAGHEISNLCVEADNAGFFATLSENAVVKNITFNTAVIEGKSSAGAVASVITDNAKIENISVVSSSVEADDYAAAIVGNIQSSDSKIASCNVTGCTVSADNAAGVAAFVKGKTEITSTNVDASEIKGEETAGGITAFASAEELSIRNCKSSADVSADKAGGIIGVSDKTLKIINCEVDGTVSGKKAEGGIVGFADGSVNVNGSKTLASLSGKADNTAEIVAKFATRPEDNEQFANSFAKNTISGNYDEFEPALMQYQNLVSAQKEVKQISLKGNGTEKDPYIISSARDLAKIPDSSTAYFVMDSDITISEKDYSISVNKDGETVYGVFNNGYEPIKNFAGVFDGNGHIIKGLYIDSDSDYVGLFANITANGAVKNLHVELLEESAGLGYYGIKGNDYVGGIAGYCDSTKGIDNCSVAGSVISGGHAVGGVVGGLASSDITNSFASTEIKAQNKSGGLVGVTTGNVTVNNCFASCEVNAAGGTLIGSNNGDLSLTDVMVNGISHGTGSVVVAENNGTIKATRMLIAGVNEDEKETILKADESKYVYSDKTTLGISEDGIKALTTSKLTSSKPEGLEKWTQNEGKYPVPDMADEYSDKMSASAATPAGEEQNTESVGNVSIDYKLTNKTGDKSMDSKLVGVLIKSKSNGMTVTSDFFTSCNEEAKSLDKLIVTTGGFYIDSNLPAGYEFKVTAKNADGRKINISDAGNMGAYIECGAEDDITLEISIIKAEAPWGFISLWESLVR